MRDFIVSHDSIFDWNGLSHSAAEPQPNVAGVSVLDKMWWFGKNAISQEEQKRHERVYRET
jgi:hypothetical protein